MAPEVPLARGRRAGRAHAKRTWFAARAHEWKLFGMYYKKGQICPKTSGFSPGFCPLFSRASSCWLGAAVIRGETVHPLVHLSGADDEGQGSGEADGSGRRPCGPRSIRAYSRGSICSRAIMADTHAL